MILIAYGAPSVVALLFTTALGLFVYLKNRRGLANVFFFQWLMALSIWHLGSALTYFVETPGAGLFASRLAHAGAIFIPPTFLHFIISFLGLDKAKRGFIATSYTVAVLLEMSNFTPFFIHHAARLSYNYYGVPGVLYLVFVLFFFSIVVYSLFLLSLSYRQASGWRKSQIKYLFMASLIGYGGGSIDFLPIFGIDVYAIGNAVNIVFAGIVAYEFNKEQEFKKWMEERGTILKMNSELNARPPRGGARERASGTQAEGVGE